MICQLCRKAGELNTESNRNRSKATQKLATALHRDCKGGTWCDCQHVVGHALNLQLIKSG